MISQDASRIIPCHHFYSGYCNMRFQNDKPRFSWTIGTNMSYGNFDLERWTWDCWESREFCGVCSIPEDGSHPEKCQFFGWNPQFRCFKMLFIAAHNHSHLTIAMIFVDGLNVRIGRQYGCLGMFDYTVFLPLCVIIWFLDVDFMTNFRETKVRFMYCWPLW